MGQVQLPNAGGGSIVLGVSDRRPRRVVGTHAFEEPGRTVAGRELTQEDMISYGFSVRHWQMIEAGRPMTMFTLLRVCEAFNVPLEQLVRGLAHHLGKRKKE